jgi:hypothetical protein
LSKSIYRDNRLYTEPRCVEGNYGLPGIIHGRRTEERAFVEGRGPDPSIRDAMKDGFIFDDEPLRHQGHPRHDPEGDFHFPLGETAKRTNDRLSSK